MDYRETISALIPMIVTIVIFIGFLTCGFFWGYKRALYWGLGNWFFMLFGLLIYTFFQNPIADAFSNLTFLIMQIFGIGVDQDVIAAMIPFIKELTGPIIYLLSLIIGNIILGILWVALFKRILRLSKMNKVNHSRRYKIMSSASGVAISFILFTPITANLGQIAYATTTTQENVAANEDSSNFYSVINTIFEANPAKYYSNPLVTVDSFMTSLKISTNKETIDTIINPIIDFITGNIPINADGNPDPNILIENLKNILKDSTTIDQLETVFKSPAMTESFTNIIKLHLPGEKVTKEVFQNTIDLIIVPGELKGDVNIPQASYDIIKSFIISDVLDQTTFETEGISHEQALIDMNNMVDKMLSALFVKP